MEDERSYLPPVAIGEPMRASGVGQVVASENEELPVGTLVQGLLNWQEYSIGNAEGAMPVQPLPAGTPPGMALSVFGSTSLLCPIQLGLTLPIGAAVRPVGISHGWANVKKPS